ncbi:DMT family transporter [Sphingomonadaceae bacterium jetA1]|jgi:drug/metabolite transporter (DMT)-like permease|uniref:EamA family transporter n=1 Tax=Facivitalis istanbulensis TaxID=3075838 RepID=UPI00348C0D6C
MEPPAQTRRRLTGILCGLAAALIWGGFPVMTRLGVAHSSLDMFDVTFLRFAVSGLLLLPPLVRSGFGKIGFLPVALMVFGIGAPYMLIVSYGLTQAPVGVFAVTTPGSMIAFSGLLSALWLRNRISRGERISLLTITAGICLAGYYEFTGMAGRGNALGVFLIGGFL